MLYSFLSLRFHSPLSASFILFFLLSSSAFANIQFDTGRLQPTELERELVNQLVCYPMKQLAVKRQRPTLTQKDICLAVIYQKRNALPYWVSPEGPNSKAQIILKHLQFSAAHGLDPSDFKVERIRQIWYSKKPAELAELETLLTYSLVKYIHDVSYGQLKPLEKNPKLFAEAGETAFDPTNAIEIAASSANLDSFLSNLPPSHHHYRRLQKALQKYQQIADQGGWPLIEEGDSLYAGDIDKRIPAIRKRMQLTGDLPALLPSSQSLFFDIQLEKAVLRFQKRNGLETDGIIGPNTRQVMNITAQERVDTIRLNLARWRWQSHSLGEKYILVNIAGFSLQAYRKFGSDLSLDIPVIVGKRQHQTPIFSDRIKYLDINPFWNITPSIAKNEELPELRKNPHYLVERHVRLFSSWKADAVELDSTTIDWHNISRSQISSYKLRQDPGPWNALGKIKFVFPNKYSVYMHDTPTPDLFNHTQRSFSHGCIRISDPLALAIFSLEEQDSTWTKEKIIELYSQNSRKVIRLPKPLPVHITYQTTWVDKDGTINFNSDIYARDKELHNALLR